MSAVADAVPARHAQAAVDEYGKHYKAGEFLPFYVPRQFMPQVDTSCYPQLVASALEHGPGCTFDVVPVSSLRAHQRINHLRAASLDERVLLKPLVVSRDGYIVDGNHRWWGHVYQHLPMVPVIRLNLDFDDAVAWALEQPGVYTISMTEVRDGHS